MFCYDVLTSKIDSPRILQALNIHCPSVLLRRQETIRVSNNSTNYGKFEPVNRMGRNFNEISHIFDYNLNRNTFKNLITEFIC